MLVVSYNPGYQNILKSLKPSTRQRFVAIEFDFPPPERRPRSSPRERPAAGAGARRWSTSAMRLRELKGQDLEEGVSTRLLVYGATLIHAGMKLEAAIQAAMIEPLTDDADVKQGLLERRRAHARLRARMASFLEPEEFVGGIWHRLVGSA